MHLWGKVIAPLCHPSGAIYFVLRQSLSLDLGLVTRLVWLAVEPQDTAFASLGLETANAC